MWWKKSVKLALGSKLYVTDPNLNGNIIDTKSWGVFNLSKLPLNGEYQIFNLRVAIGMLDYLQVNGLIDISKDEVGTRLAEVDWPGRLHRMDYCYDQLSKKTLPILMDGAHNGSAAIELVKYLRKEYGDQASFDLCHGCNCRQKLRTTVPAFVATNRSTYSYTVR